MAKNKIEVGSVWSRHSFGTVVSVSKTQVLVRNEAGKEWPVGLDLFDDEFKTAKNGSFSSTTKLSRTEIIEKFESLQRQAVVVNFNKKVDKADLISNIQKVFRSNAGIPGVEQITKLVAADLDGENRTMTGYHFGNRDNFGRIHFTEVGQGARLVDPRTINWFIADDVKYEAR